MVKQLVVLGLIASMLVVLRAGPAAACSCVPLQPGEALADFDAAFVGELVERPPSHGAYQEEAPYRFEVETWVKGDLGPEVVVLSPNQGSACGFEVAPGQRVGVLLRVEGDKIKGGLCTTVDADLLLAGGWPLAVDGTGPPVFLLAGYTGAGRLMLVDASGGLVAAVGEQDRVLNEIALCPGAAALVEMVDDELVVRSTADLAEIGRVGLGGLPYRVSVPRIWCRDEQGEELWLATDEWSERTGAIYRVFDVDDLDQPILEGPYRWLEAGAGYAVAGEAPSGERIWRIDLDTSEPVLLHFIPVDDGDSPPSGTGWMHPSGEEVMISEARRRDDGGGSTRFLLYDIAQGSTIWESEPVAFADGIGWVDDQSFLISTYPDLDGDQVDFFLFDRRTQELQRLSGLPGWPPKRVGDRLVGVDRGHLRAMPLGGGEVVELRLLPTESHRLVAVLDPAATVTPTTVDAASSPDQTPAATAVPPTGGVATTVPAPDSQPEVTAGLEDREPTSPSRPWILVAGVVAAAGGAVVLGRRRRT